MDCLVHHAAGVVGRVDLDWNKATSAEPPDAGPTIFGMMVPTAVYAEIRATCQALRQALHHDFYMQQPALQMPPGMVATESFDSFERRMRALDAARALALRLTRPDGAEVPTVQVLIEDFTLTAEERAGLPPHDPRATGEHMLVVATMPPGATPPPG